MRKSEHRSGNHPQQFIKEVEINGKIVKAPTETNNYCIYDDKVIFLLYGTGIDERNIWCYKDDGTLLWKIEESPHWLEWLENNLQKKNKRYLLEVIRIIIGILVIIKIQKQEKNG